MVLVRKFFAPFFLLRIKEVWRTGSQLLRSLILKSDFHPLFTTRPVRKFFAPLLPNLSRVASLLSYIFFYEYLRSEPS